MACPICCATMQNLGINYANATVWHCPRCGTTKTAVFRCGGEWSSSVVVPSLVGLVRELIAKANVAGIREAAGLAREEESGS